MTATGWSAQRLARTAGVLYLVVVVVGMFSPMVLETLVVPGDAAATAERVLGSSGLFGVSLVGWIVIAVTDVAISVVLYLLLEPINRGLSLVAAAYRLVYSGVLAAFLLLLFRGYLSLAGAGAGARGGGRVAGAGAAEQLHAAALADFETFAGGFVLALVFFGVHLVVLGILLKRSTYVPRFLAVLIAVAGVGYVADGLATFFLPSHGDTLRIVLLTPALLAEVGLTGWLLVKGVSVRDEPTLRHH